MTNSQQMFPPLNSDHYQWKQSKNSSGWERPALAAETTWIHGPREYQQLFLTACLTLLRPVSRYKFYSAARHSWIRLRYETPDIDVTAKMTDEGQPYMYAHVLRNHAEAARWSRETLFLDNAQQEVGFGALKNKLSQDQAAVQCSSPISLLLITINDGDDVVRRVELILNVEHQITDGIGIRILLSKYLYILAKNALKSDMSQDTSRIDWGENSKLLTTPWICSLNEDQIFSGPEYEEAVSWNQKFMFEKMVSHLPPTPSFYHSFLLTGEVQYKNVGLGLLRKTESSQKHHFITFTQSRSNKILHAIKTILSPEANITHLGHAAMVLALLRNATVPELQLVSENTVLYSPCWINGRRYIRNTDAQLPATKSFIPICQTFAPIIFPNLRDLVLHRNATQVEMKSKLLKACEIAKEQYGNIKRTKSIMPESVAVLEFMGSKMYE
jgi:hypothetical protein